MLQRKASEGKKSFILKLRFKVWSRIKRGDIKTGRERETKRDIFLRQEREHEPNNTQITNVRFTLFLDVPIRLAIGAAKKGEREREFWFIFLYSTFLFFITPRCVEPFFLSFFDLKFSSKIFFSSFLLFFCAPMIRFMWAMFMARVCVWFFLCAVLALFDLHSKHFSLKAPTLSSLDATRSSNGLNDEWHVNSSAHAVMC